MVHEINIYGDIVPFKWFNDGSEYDRKDLNDAIDNLDLNEGDELICNIHTFGGCTTTAFSMYNKLLRTKNQKGVSITTRADGYCASSGVILLLAGDKRIGNKFLLPFIHNAWTWVVGDKNDAKKVYEDLERVDNQIAELYAERTSIEKDKALELMNESRDVTIDECLDYGFYTELENVYTAENAVILNSLRTRNFKNRKMSKEQITKEEFEAKSNSLMNKLNDIWNKINGTVKNKVVQDANGTEIDFYELESDDTPEVDDKARVDGTNASGDYTMPSGEVYTFEEGVLTAITAEDGEMDALKEKNEELECTCNNQKQTIADLEAQIEQKDTLITETQNEVKELKASFEEYKTKVSSSFDYEPAQEPKKEQPKVNKSRKLYKES